MKKLSKELVAIIKPKVTEYNHRGTERTEDEHGDRFFSFDPGLKSCASL